MHVACTEPISAGAACYNVNPSSAKAPGVRDLGQCIVTEGETAHLRICLVKQVSCYDLYTTLSTDVGALARSSTCRSGPLALWELPGASVDFRIVADSPDAECLAGQRLWAEYVKGWEYKRWEGRVDAPESVDWDAYDIVLSVDIAVPERIVRLHRQTLWCYMFVEGGPEGALRTHAGAPAYSYNVFLNHSPATRLMASASAQRIRMAASRRAVLDFPYYLLSDTTLSSIYGPLSTAPRSGTCLASTSRDRTTAQMATKLEAFGALRRSYDSLSELHAQMASSKYFVVLPGSPPRAGGALVDAVSAGCVVLAPGPSVRSFRSFLLPELAFSTDGGLLRRLDALESDRALYEQARARQAEVVRLQFCRYPLVNLATLHKAFGMSKSPRSVQRIAESLDAHVASLLRLTRKTLVQSRPGSDAPR
jgi:hypothetical protein